MITLYQINPPAGLPLSASPYCAKLELYLRLTERPFETAKGDIMKSPTKTVPYVKWPDGALQGDSGEIVAKLEAEGPSMNEGLSDELSRQGKTLETLAEDVLYFSNLYTGFVHEDGWAITKAGLKQDLPWFLAFFLPGVIRGSQKKKCVEHGFSGASDYTKAVEALKEVSTTLGDQDFLLGDTPRSYDCSVWANLALMAYGPVPNPPRETVRADANLLAYVRRLAERGGIALPPLS